MKVTLTRVTERPVEAIEEAASNCYNSEPSSNGKIMKHCHKLGHHSVLEFADFTFHIEGISRACSHQLVRHRIASYAQRSQRYVKEDNFKYVTPKDILKNTEALKIYTEFMNTCQVTYDALITLGIEVEDARFALPNACETVLEVKMNGRTLMNFLAERLCKRAQWEIREVAKQMLQAVKEHDSQCEEYAKLCGPKCERYGKNLGFCTEEKSCGKHPKLKNIIEDSNHYHALREILKGEGDFDE